PVADKHQHADHESRPLERAQAPARKRLIKGNRHSILPSPSSRGLVSGGSEGASERRIIERWGSSRSPFSAARHPSQSFSGSAAPHSLCRNEHKSLFALCLRNILRSGCP